MEKKRNVTIDIAKGIGIALVVFGHNVAILQNPGILKQVIYSFHVGLFFFLSGVFLHSQDGWKIALIARVDSLLKPYFVASIIVSVLMAASSLRMDKDIRFDFARHIKGISYSAGSSIVVGPGWFLPHLFISALTAWTLIRFINSKALLLIIGALSFILGAHILRPPELAWSLDILPISLSLLLAGHLYRQQVIEFNFSIFNFLLAALFFTGLHYFYKETMDLNLRIFGPFFPATTKLILGIYLCLSAAALISKVRIFSRLITYLGSGSLFILLFHGYFQGRAAGALAKRIEGGFWPTALSFIIGLAIPLAFWEITRRNKWLRAALLPTYRQKKIKPVFDAKTGAELKTHSADNQTAESLPPRASR